MNSAVEGFIVASTCIDTTSWAVSAGDNEEKNRRHSKIRFIKQA
jgi:hypothetical protein